MNATTDTQAAQAGTAPNTGHAATWQHMLPAVAALATATQLVGEAATSCGHRCGGQASLQSPPDPELVETSHDLVLAGDRLTSTSHALHQTVQSATEPSATALQSIRSHIHEARNLLAAVHLTADDLIDAMLPTLGEPAQSQVEPALQTVSVQVDHWHTVETPVVRHIRALADFNAG